MCFLFLFLFFFWCFSLEKKQVYFLKKWYSSNNISPSLKKLSWLIRVPVSPKITGCIFLEFFAGNHCLKQTNLWDLQKWDRWQFFCDNGQLFLQPAVMCVSHFGSSFWLPQVENALNFLSALCSYLQMWAPKMLEAALWRPIATVLEGSRSY